MKELSRSSFLGWNVSTTSSLALASCAATYLPRPMYFSSHLCSASTWYEDCVVYFVLCATSYQAFRQVYYIRMKLNKAMVRDYPYVQRWLLDMWSIPEVRRASNMRHAKAGYFGRTGNNIIPDGPLYPAKPDTLLYPAPDFACAAANSELQVKGSIIGNILDAVKGETSEGVGRADTFMPENRNEEVAKTRVPSRRGGGVGGTPSSGGVRGSDSVRDRTDSDHDRFQGGRRKRSSDSMSFGMFTVLSVGLVGAGLGVLVGRRFGGVRL